MTMSNSSKCSEEQSPRYPFLDLAAVNAPCAGRLAEAACRVIESGRYIGGEEVEAFEGELAALAGTDCAVGTGNGYDALRLILRAWVEMGCLQPGDEVIVPAHTFIASVLAVSDASLVPVPVDADPLTMNLDTSLVEAALTSRTRAIMPVHLYGRVCWDDTLASLAASRGLLVVEDCAQAIGARSAVAGLSGSCRAGALGHASAISFYPTKNVGALGDAGAVLTSDCELAATVRALANYGSDRRYHNIYAGVNSRLDPIQAAMLRVKISCVAEENAARFARAMAYERTICRADLVRPLMSDSVTDCVWHQYVVRFTGPSRDLFRRRLLEAGVATDVHYPVPPHLQPCYARRQLARTPLPVAESICCQAVSLPIAGALTVADAAAIARIINDLEI